VPAFHEDAYAATVAAQGRSNLLVQQLVDEVGRCPSSVDPAVGASEGLVRWMTEGIAPAPGLR
jgi:hypothetical protein